MPYESKQIIAFLQQLIQYAVAFCAHSEKILDKTHLIPTLAIMARINGKNAL